MEFINQTAYDKRALAAMNRLAEKSVQKRKTMFSRLFCYILGILGLIGGSLLLFVIHENKTIASLSLLYGVLFLGVGIFWVPFQTWSSGRMLMQGVKHCTFTFDDEALTVENEIETSRYPYRRIDTIVEDDMWYVLFLDQKHGVVLEKAGFTAGDPAAFAAFLEGKTKQPIQQV